MIPLAPCQTHAPNLSQSPLVRETRMRLGAHRSTWRRSARRDSVQRPAGHVHGAGDVVKHVADGQQHAHHSLQSHPGICSLASRRLEDWDQVSPVPVNRNAALCAAYRTGLFTMPDLASQSGRPVGVTGRPHHRGGRMAGETGDLAAPPRCFCNGCPGLLAATACCWSTAPPVHHRLFCSR